MIAADREWFDWAGDHRPRHEADAVIYEVHVRGFTAHSSSGVAEGRRGTFAGLIDKMPYLVELGVTVVELMPVFQFDPGEGNYGRASEWRRMVDTGQDSPDDIGEKDWGAPLTSLRYIPQPRSVVVLVRPRGSCESSNDVD